MNQTETLAAQLIDLVTTTETLKRLLESDPAPERLAEICEKIAAIATEITAIGPIAPNLAGLYSAWSEVMLALGSAKAQGFTTVPIEAMDRAIAAVRTLRRTFGIAPGGA